MRKNTVLEKYLLISEYERPDKMKIKAAWGRIEKKIERKISKKIVTSSPILGRKR